MPLKYKYSSKDQVPAEHAARYVERDGAFYLDAEGVTDKVKADELRTNNIELRKQLEDFTTRFEGIDPVEVRRLAEEKRKLELQAQGHKPEEIDKIVTERLKGLKADWDKQFAAVTTERDSLTTRLTTIQIFDQWTGHKVVLNDELSQFTRLDRIHPWNFTNRHQLRNTLLLGYFCDYHCLRPYSEHKDINDFIVSCLEEKTW